jgi:hypothetical protein
MNRVLKGMIFRCLCCNRPLDSNESTRTYKGSDELIGTCNTCLVKSKETDYGYQFTQGNISDGDTTSPLHSDSHSSYFYEFFDN